MPARLLLLCLLLRSSWLTVEGDRQIGAARVLRRPGGRAVVAVSVDVAVGVPKGQCGGLLWKRRGLLELDPKRKRRLQPARQEQRRTVDVRPAVSLSIGSMATRSSRWSGEPSGERGSANITRATPAAPWPRIVVTHGL